MTISRQVLNFESIWANSSSSTPSHKNQKARCVLLESVRLLLKDSGKSPQSLEEALQIAESTVQSTPRDELREIAILFIRALAIPGVVPTNEDAPDIDRRLLALIEKGVTDIWDRSIKDKKQMTFLKRREIESVHSALASEVKKITNLPSTPDGFIASRQEVLKVINSKHILSYLSIFGIRPIAINMKSIYDALESLRNSIDHDFWLKLESTRENITEQQQWINDNLTFLTTEYYRPFLESAQQALSGIDLESRKRFICKIRSRTSDEFYIERRLPLHDSSRLVSIQIPLLNEGPGIATGVNILVDTENQPIVWGGTSINLGDIRPGEFAFTIEVMVERPLSELSIHFKVSWGSYANAEIQQKSLTARVRAQAQDVDWKNLERREPYSTDVAEGLEFFGRQEKVASLSGRLLKDHMQSSYITGQKRIGKSSLAHAIVSNISNSLDGINFHFLYLEYGEYAHTDPAETLAILGVKIEEFLLGESEITVTSAIRGIYKGTLSPLSALSEKIYRKFPVKKFVVILDEFDEIPQEIYRMGSLAETFFANLRTLSAKRNLAFMLVGGENMPYIVSAQGDQLNKFIREGLNLFSRSTEWNDFVKLVRNPVEGQLSWHESAINQVFELCNGHPYYAKLLCARAYSRAVSERDTEIAASEVRRAYHELISSLDVNVFAHLWKDGIQGTRDEAEVISLQRCRVLACIARVCRLRMPLTLETIKSANNSAQLASHSIEPILNEFCRRGILEDKGGSYEFSLPMFRDWLIEVGINKLIADTLGDDLAKNLQECEDRSYVSDSEIESMVQTWGLYRGMKIGLHDVRQWIGQVSKLRQQRLLFKLLRNIRFYSEFEIRDKLRLAHSLVLRTVPEFVRKSPADRRADIVVTYVDGPGKSGSYYASRYAEENIIAADCVKDMSGFANLLVAHEDTNNISINGIVIVDDFVGTGQNLSENVRKFVGANCEELLNRNATVVIVVLVATKIGEKNLRAALLKITKETTVKTDLRICDPLDDKHFAFTQRSALWDSLDEAAEAKALCLDLGAKLQKASPLGFESQGMLVVFPNTVPNNTLPILHDTKGGAEPWKALFVRPKN